jgi:hypothetical protein
VVEIEMATTVKIAVRLSDRRLILSRCDSGAKGLFIFRGVDP